MNEKLKIVVIDNIVKLEDCGISPDLSSRAQRIAAVPKDEFEIGYELLSSAVSLRLPIWLGHLVEHYSKSSR